MNKSNDYIVPWEITAERKKKKMLWIVIDFFIFIIDVSEKEQTAK